MAHIQFTDVQDRPLEFLDLTSLTLDEFQQLVPPFEAAFQAHMAAWRLDGKPRTARRFTVYNNCPLPTPEDRLLFRRCFRPVDHVSDCHPKLIPIDKETNVQVVHAFGLGKTDRPADQSLDPRAPINVFALDLLGVCLPHVMLRGIEMPFVGIPPVGEIARDAKRLPLNLSYFVARKI